MMTFDEALTAAQTLDLDALLTLPPAAKADLQNALLSRMIELVYEGHPYYSRLMRQLGLKPADITTVDDLVLLPVTTKQQFLADPDAFRLNVPSLPVEMRALWEVIYTTGTSTGVPAPVYSTTFDHLAYMHQARRRRSFIPLSERDIVVSLFPATTFPMGAYNRAVSEAAAYGAALVLAQTGRPPRYFGLHRSLADAAELVVSHRATVLWGVASFVRRLLLHAETHQLDFSSVRMVMVTGEASSVAALEGMRNRLRRLDRAGHHDGRMPARQRVPQPGPGSDLLGSG
jgi:phenylacetate-coenzyme A ligase PaaK-like adenylate-forming protein